MALQPSGPIKMSEIKAELGTTSNSLRTYSSLASKDAPDSMSEFYGYSSYVPPDPIDFTYVAGGQYKNEGTLLVTSATGGVGTKVWYLNNGAGGTYTGPYTINTNTQTGLGNQIYTMKVEDSATPTPNFKIYQYQFNLPRRVGTTMTLYWVLQSSYPSPTSTAGWSSGVVETNTFTTGTPAQIFAAASKFLIGSSLNGFGNVTFWVSDGTTYKQAFHPTSTSPDAFFEVAEIQTLTSNTGAGTAFPTPTQYTFIRYNVDSNCDDSNATQVWSYTNYSDGFYTIGGTLYRLVSSTHSTYTNEITTATPSSCTPASDCECYTIYNEGDTSGQYRYNRCSDGLLVTGNIPRNSTQTICVSNGGTVEIVSGNLTDVPCGTPCNTNGDCSTC
jgi:hypothetical protein